MDPPKPTSLPAQWCARSASDHSPTGCRSPLRTATDVEFSCGRSIGPFGPKPACKSAEPAAAATACSSSSGYCQRRQHLVSIVSAGSETCALPCAQGPHRTLCERATFRLTLALHYLDAEPARAPVNTVTLSSAMPWRRWIVWVVGPSWQSCWTAMHGQPVAHHSVRMQWPGRWTCTTLDPTRT